MRSLASVLFLLALPHLARAAAFPDAPDRFPEIQQWAQAHRDRVLSEAPKAYDDAVARGDEAGELRALRLLNLATGTDLFASVAQKQQLDRLAMLAGRLHSAPAAIEQLLSRAVGTGLVVHDFEAALLLLEEAEGLAKGDLRPRYIGTIDEYRGSIFAGQGRSSDALQEFLAAGKECESIHDETCTLEILLQTGQLIRWIDSTDSDLRQMLGLMQAALPLTANRHDGMETALRDAIGTVRERLHDVPGAVREFDAALKALPTRGIPPVERRYRQGILWLRKAQMSEELNHYGEALDLLDQSRTALDVDKLPNGFGGLEKLARAEALAHLGQPGQARSELAAARVDMVRFDRLKVTYHAKAADILAYLGDWRAAYDELVEHEAAERSLLARRNRSLEEEYRIRYMTELQNSANQQLIARQSADRANRMALMLALAMSVLLFGGLALSLLYRSRTLRSANETLQRLGHVGRRLASSLDVGTVLGCFSEEMREMTLASGVSTWLTDEQGARSEWDGDSCVADAELALRLRALVDSCLLARHGVSAEDRAADGSRRFFECFPLIDGQLILGAACVWRDRPFAAREREMSNALAVYAAIAISNARKATSLSRAQIELESERARTVVVHAAKLVAVGSMASGLVHEMSHPVGAMMLQKDDAIDALADGNLVDADEAVRRIAREAERLERLIRRLRDFTRADPPHLRPIRLSAMLADARALFGPRLRMEHIDYTEQVDDVFVLVDAERLSLVLANIVFNAIDAMESSNPRSIVVTSGPPIGARAVLHVRDSGPGLPLDLLDRIFQPFVTTKPSGKGLGLGMSISAQALEGMGGGITALNHPDGGAVFTLLLPLVEVFAESVVA